MPSYNPRAIEPLAAVLGREQDLPHAGRRPTSRSSTSSTCSPTPPAPACTSATPRATPPPTSSPATAACAASTSCTRWAGTPSACPPSSTPSTPASTPRVNTQRNIDNFRRQIQTLGFSYDWDREVDTTDPPTSAGRSGSSCVLFDTWYDADAEQGPAHRRTAHPAEVQAQGEDAIRAYRDGKRLAYQAEVPVNWCPALGTVLANEEVIDGKSERGGHPGRAHAAAAVDAAHHRLRRAPARRPGAARLVRVDQGDAAQLDRQERRRGGRFRPAPTGDEPIRVFTTRPDTLFGATYMVLAPGASAGRARSPRRRRRRPSRRTSEAARARATSSAPSWPRRRPASSPGAYAVNPVNGEQIPIWIADYVLATYGTGAIMAVPGARRARLRVRQAVRPADPRRRPPDRRVAGRRRSSTLDI